MKKAGIILGIGICLVLGIGVGIGITWYANLKVQARSEQLMAENERVDQKAEEDIKKEDRMPLEEAKNEQAKEQEEEHGLISVQLERVKKAYIDAEEKKERVLLNEMQGDFDQDGYEEIILSFGKKPREIIKDCEYEDVWLEVSYAIRVKENEIEDLGCCEVPSNGYCIYMLKKVHMAGNNRDYIGVFTTNGMYPLGCGLYTMDENEIKCIGDFSSPTGSGEARFEGEKDAYTSIVLWKNDYSTHYYTVCEQYMWNGTGFNESVDKVSMDKKVENAEETVKYFLELSLADRRYNDATLIEKRRALVKNDTMDLLAVDISECLDWMYTGKDFDDPWGNMHFSASHDERFSVFTVSSNERLNTEAYEFVVEWDSGKLYIVEIKHIA